MTFSFCAKCFLSQRFNLFGYFTSILLFTNVISNESPMNIKVITLVYMCRHIKCQTGQTLFWIHIYIYLYIYTNSVPFVSLIHY